MDVRRKGFITPELATEYLAGAVLLGAAFATTVGVLTEVPVMLALCWIVFFHNKVWRMWFLVRSQGLAFQ